MIMKNFMFKIRKSLLVLYMIIKLFKTKKKSRAFSYMTPKKNNLNFNFHKNNLSN